jgi:hypothetical protein
MCPGLADGTSSEAGTGSDVAGTIAVASGGSTRVTVAVADVGWEDGDVAGAGSASESWAAEGVEEDGDKASSAGGTVGDGANEEAGAGVSASGRPVATGVDGVAGVVTAVGPGDGEPAGAPVGDGGDGVTSVGVEGLDVGVRVGTVCRRESWAGVAQDARPTNPATTRPASRSVSAALPARNLGRLFMGTPSPMDHR